MYGHKLNLPEICAHPFRDYANLIENDIQSPDFNRSHENMNIAKFNFSQLCDDAVGAADYIAISQLFDIVYINKVPELTLNNRNQVTLYVTLLT